MGDRDWVDDLRSYYCSPQLAHDDDAKAVRSLLQEVDGLRTALDEVQHAPRQEDVELIDRLGAKVEKWKQAAVDAQLKLDAERIEHRKTKAEVERLRAFAAWAQPEEQDGHPAEFADGWECTRCGQSVRIDAEHEQPDHGICWLCCTDIVTELFERARAALDGEGEG